MFSEFFSYKTPVFATALNIVQGKVLVEIFFSTNEALSHRTSWMTFHPSVQRFLLGSSDV